MTTLTLTPQLGRQSTRYPDGRPYKASWNSVRIAYPRPTAERNAGGTYDGGLNGEYDKWLAGVPWYPCLGVMHGAFPYKVEISGETVDGVSASTGVQYAQYIEDHAATTPYLGFYHAGFTAPAAGTKVIAFTITVTDCLGETDTYPVSLTVYAQDHADVLTYFRAVDTTAGTNGTGHWNSPINTISGADVNSNKTLFGTDWSSTTHCPKTVTVLFKDGSTIAVSGMTNVGGGLVGVNAAKLAFIQNGYFPRRFIGVYGATVTCDGANPTGFNSGSEQPNDVLIKNITFANNVTDGFMAINTAGRRRVAIHDCKFNDWLSGQTGSNEAPVRNEGSSKNYDYTVLRCTGDGLYSSEAAGGNTFLFLTWLSQEHSLIDDLTLTNLTFVTNRPDGVMRIKHDSRDCEWRRITALYPASQLVLSAICLLSTGGGADVVAERDKHVRFLGRYLNIQAISSNAFQTLVSSTTNEEHSLQLHFSSFRGGLTIAADSTTTIANAHEFLGYKNLIRNAASGFTLTNMTPISGEGSTTDGNVGATTGVLNDDGSPVDSQYLGAIGHTVITV